jgi:hypothetical protein
VFNLETNTVVESCDVTFDETALCPHDVFECVGVKEMDESIFVDKGLQGIDGDEDNPLLPSTSSLDPVPASTLKQRLLRLLHFPQQQWRRHGLRGRLSPSRKLPPTFRRRIHLRRS